MSLVSASIHIDAPPPEVWDVVMDPERLSDWVTIHRRLDRADGGPPRPGYEMEQHIHLRGATFKVRWTLAQCRDGERAVWEGRGPARSRAHTEYLLRADDSGTRFDYSNEFHPPLGPLGAIASRAIVGGVPQREANRSLERLRALVERLRG
jgi:carbon monoxide dehydrogenase subunit G